MDFKDMSYIIAIAKHNSITKAAESLYISQPTLSKFLQNLEKKLGVRLFKKVGHKFIPTHAGERYVMMAKNIMQTKKELDREIQDIIKSEAGVLNIAFPLMRGSYMLPCTLPEFNRKFPNVKIHIFESASSNLEELIVSGEADLAFFNLPVKHPEVTYEIITTEEILVIMSKNHPLCERGLKKTFSKYDWIDLCLLKDEIFILNQKSQRTRQTVDKVLSELEVKPERTIVTGNIRAGAKLAATGYGIGFICDTHLKHMIIEDDYEIFSFGKNSVKVNFIVAYRKDAYLTSYAIEFIKIVKNSI